MAMKLGAYWAESAAKETLILSSGFPLPTAEPVFAAGLAAPWPQAVSNIARTGARSALSGRFTLVPPRCGQGLRMWWRILPKPLFIDSRSGHDLLQRHIRLGVANFGHDHCMGRRIDLRQNLELQVAQAIL